MPSFVLHVLVLLTLTAAACSPRVTPLAHTTASSDALARAVLAALAAGDRDALERLAVSETEFREHVWPELPAARPERNLPFSYVWGELRQKSGASLTASLGALRGETRTLESVRMGEVTPYPSYTVHRRVVFVVRRPDGTTEDLRVCGSFLEQQGRWKVFSYVTSD